MAEQLDLSHAPTGELSATRLVHAVAGSDDRVERHYLEVKGPLDVTSRSAAAKIAKFILGAANRQPHVASTAFEGWAVMIIGVSQGSIVGMPPVEMMELDRLVEPYVGVRGKGPLWDVVRVQVPESDHEVLLVVVSPPTVGQPMYVCRANGDGITSGRIYMRADGETREANADEIDLLVERSRVTSVSEVNFEVEIVGGVIPYVFDEEATLEEYLSLNKRALFDAEKAPQSIASGGLKSVRDSTAASLVGAISFAFPPIAEDRSSQAYRAAISSWEAGFRERWAPAVVEYLGQLLPTMEVRITNRAKTFFEDVELHLHLEGDVKGTEILQELARRPKDFDLPSPPRPWGDRPNPGPPGLKIAPDQLHWAAQMPRSFVASNSEWKNSGSVDCTIDVGDLRPSGTWHHVDDDLVLVLPAGCADSVRVTWRITARGHHDVYEGSFDAPVPTAMDVTPALRGMLGLAEL